MLRNTLEQDASYLPNSSKPHHSSSYQRRTDPYPPVKGYCYLNSHTIQNMYPLPLIPKLIDDMKDTTLFTNFDIWWCYNNIHIWEEDQWKAAFIIITLGLFKPTVMFFRFCNVLFTFQAFMNYIFANMLMEKWLKIYMDDLDIHTNVTSPFITKELVVLPSDPGIPLSLLRQGDLLPVSPTSTQKLFLTSPTLSTNIFICPCIPNLWHLSPLHSYDSHITSQCGCSTHEPDANGDLHPCAYFGKTFTPAEWNCDIYDWELLAVILGLDK